ncbi:aldehyde dehydrogenase (NADP(+)), partial [Azospirillum brasilense]
MTITGEMLIGARSHRGSDGEFRAVDPATGGVAAPAFGGGGGAEVIRPCARARARFLNNIDATGEQWRVN